MPFLFGEIFTLTKISVVLIKQGLPPSKYFQNIDQKNIMKKLILITMLSSSLIILGRQMKEISMPTSQKVEPSTIQDKPKALGINISGSIEVTIKAGHNFKECAGVGEWCYNSMFFYRCHIPCIGFGDNCQFKFKLGKGIANNNGTHHEEDTDYIDFTSENDTLYVEPMDLASAPERNVWKSFSIKPETSGYPKYINISAQDTDMLRTADGKKYYKIQNVTYTPQAQFGETY